MRFRIFRSARCLLRHTFVREVHDSNGSVLPVHDKANPMLILLTFALLSGLMTVLSPCILPLLPIVLTSTAGGRRRPLGIVAGLVVSFSLATLLLARWIGTLALSANTLRSAAVFVIGLMGLTLLIPALNRAVERALSRLTTRLPHARTSGDGVGQGLLIGLSLGLLWVPCAGPILAAIIALTATQSVTANAVAVVVAYAVGAALPLLGIAYGGRSLVQRTQGLARRPLPMQRAFGLVMILTALLVALNVDQSASRWAANLLPESWSTRLTAWERSPQVADQLDGLRPAESTAPAAPAPTPSAAQGGDSPSQTATLPPPPPAAPTATPLVALDTLGPAPELRGIAHWINSEPLTLESLRGKVVLVEFWTFGCINCQRTLPYVTTWYDTYKDEGFVVIGVHTPEFAYEYETANVEQAVAEHGIGYPVAQDNEFKTWRAYDNHYWPAHYFIDAEGNIRYLHIGEGKYEESELVIQQLLAEANATITPSR